MIGCDKTVTLARHIKEKDADRYTLTVLHGVGYTEEVKLQLEGTMVTAADLLTVTIPQGVCTVVPRKDDYIICGALTGELDGLSALRACGLPCYRVTAVNDYRGDILGHWEVIGS